MSPPLDLPAASPTPREILVNRTGSEIRLALREAGRLVEMHVEREESLSPVGNIYKGRVSRILPGMQAAFVRIGTGRDAFLHLHDLPEGRPPRGAHDQEPAAEAGPAPRIEEILHEGQDVLVQVQKEAVSGKGPRVTTRISLPARYLVLVPGLPGLGVSRRIVDGDERRRLRDAVASLCPEGTGCIVRTAAAGVAVEELRAELRWLTGQWLEVTRRAEVAPAGTLLHAESDPLYRLLRDLGHAGLRRILLDDRLLHGACVESLRALAPGLEACVELYTGEEPMFDRLGVQAEIDEALSGRVWLRSGGYLVIHETEALVAIDVNTGKFVGRRRPEETVLRTNLEAAAEVARQMRLRDLAGIVVVDFIDMAEEASRREVLHSLRAEIARDRARTRVLPFSEFGVVEITRQRARRSLDRVLCRPCPDCAGAGRVRTPRTLFHEIQRELQRIAPHLGGRRLVVRAHPDVADLVLERRRHLLEPLRHEPPVDVEVARDPGMGRERYDLICLPAGV